MNLSRSQDSYGFITHDLYLSPVFKGHSLIGQSRFLTICSGSPIRFFFPPGSTSVESLKHMVRL